jgi:hypothetical protein
MMNRNGHFDFFALRQTAQIGVNQTTFESDQSDGPEKSRRRAFARISSEKSY